MGPAIALLMVKVPIGFGNTVRLHKGIGRQAVGVLSRLPYTVAHKFCIYARVNNKMCNVDISWSQLAGHRLCQTPQSKFARGKGSISRTAANRGGCPGEEDRTFLPRHHIFSGFAPRQKRSVSAHFPDFAKNAFGCFQNWKPNIAA